MLKNHTVLVSKITRKWKSMHVNYLREIVLEFTFLKKQNWQLLTTHFVTQNRKVPESVKTAKVSVLFAA